MTITHNRDPREPFDGIELRDTGDRIGSFLPLFASVAMLALLGLVITICSVATLCGSTMPPWFAVVMVTLVSAGAYALVRSRRSPRVFRRE